MGHLNGPYYPHAFFSQSSSALTSSVFHSDPAGQLGLHLRGGGGPPNVRFFISGSCGIDSRITLFDIPSAMHLRANYLAFNMYLRKQYRLY